MCMQYLSTYITPRYRVYIGKDNVMVVGAESLQVSNMTRVQETMDAVFNFFGLCPFTLPQGMKGSLISRNTVCVFVYGLCMCVCVCNTNMYRSLICLRT